MSSIKENVEELNQMILKGKILEAFEKFYAEDIVMQDNETPAREGKSTCRKFEEEFVSKLTAFRGAQVKNVTISEEAGVAAVEWDFDYTQVSVQRRKNCKREIYV